MSVVELEKEFVNPSSRYRGKPFWAWNDALDESERRRPESISALIVNSVATAALVGDNFPASAAPLV